MLITLFKRVSLATLLATICAHFPLQATNMSLEQFEKTIKNKLPISIDKAYEKLNLDENDPDENAQAKVLAFRKTALDEIVNWIQKTALQKHFGYPGIADSDIITRLRDMLEKYVPEDDQDTIIEDILLIRTLFYPTEDEKKDIESNNNDIQNRLIKKLVEWKEWYKSYSKNNTINLYNTDDFNKKTITQTLSALGPNENLGDLTLEVSEFFESDAKQSINNLEDFKEAIKNKWPICINQVYDKLSDNLKNNDFKKAALIELINWIQKEAQQKNLGDCTIEELKKCLKNYALTEEQAKAIDKINVASLQPTIKSIQEEISKPKKPNSSYLKPAIITFAVISLSILGFLMFKKFCPHAYTKINSKLSSLLKFPQWRPRTQKTNSFPHRLNPSLMPF
ncbi:MAG: hypothetical protein UV38_C0003G0255 [candidate division TM6 bacterium GW2011_GWE2_42_60]|nr:MAG: hypothetical protein UV38_C0003G0255 [candidate division TM6 bacterium GW2011_GWE2_42_60]HBY05874.1 hypothetical protein [Candidatus Dependentiae bacterium]